jgi:hypothetical protein
MTPLFKIQFEHRVFYFRDRQIMQQALSKGDFNLMIYADMVIDLEKNIFVKLRTNVQNLADAFMLRSIVGETHDEK